MTEGVDHLLRGRMKLLLLDVEAVGRDSPKYSENLAERVRVVAIEKSV